MITKSIQGQIGTKITQVVAEMAIATNQPIVVVTAWPVIREQWAEVIPGATIMSPADLIRGIVPIPQEALIIMSELPREIIRIGCAQILNVLSNESWLVNWPGPLNKYMQMRPY